MTSLRIDHGHWHIVDGMMLNRNGDELPLSDGRPRQELAHANKTTTYYCNSQRCFGVINNDSCRDFQLSQRFSFSK
jgi:hypothetical protein